MLWFHIDLPQCQVIKIFKKINAPLHYLNEIVSLEIKRVLEYKIFKFLFCVLILDDDFVHRFKWNVCCKGMRSEYYRILRFTPKQELCHINDRSRSNLTNCYICYISKMTEHICKSLTNDINFFNLFLTNQYNTLLRPKEFNLHVLRNCQSSIVIHFEWSFQKFGVVMNYHFLFYAWQCLLNHVNHLLLALFKWCKPN